MLTLFEQNNMTHEDRKWYIRRLNKEITEKNERESKAARSSTSSMPRISKPSMPSGRR